MKIVSTSTVSAQIDTARLPAFITTSDNYGCVKILVYKSRSFGSHRLEFPSFLDIRSGKERTPSATASINTVAKRSVSDPTHTHKIELQPVKSGADAQGLVDRMTDYRRPGEKPWATFTFHYRDRNLLRHMNMFGTVTCSWGENTGQDVTRSIKRTRRDDDDYQARSYFAGAASNSVPIATRGAGANFMKRLRADSDTAESEIANTQSGIGEGYGPGSVYRSLSTWTPGSASQVTESMRREPLCEHCGGPHASRICWIQYPEKAPFGFRESEHARTLRLRFQAEKAKREALLDARSSTKGSPITESCEAESSTTLAIKSETPTPSPARSAISAYRPSHSRPTAAPTKSDVLTNALDPTTAGTSMPSPAQFANFTPARIEPSAISSTSHVSTPALGLAEAGNPTASSIRSANPTSTKPQDPRRAVPSTSVLETPASPPDSPASASPSFDELTEEMYRARITDITMPAEIVQENPENRKIMPRERLDRYTAEYRRRRGERDH